MASFQMRLRAVMEGGNLTVADLARWLERPDPTVRGWVARGIAPTGPSRDIADLIAAVTRLEIRIRRKEGLPVPRLSRGERRDYIDRLRARR